MSAASKPLRAARTGGPGVDGYAELVPGPSSGIDACEGGGFSPLTSTRLRGSRLTTLPTMVRLRGSWNTRKPPILPRANT